MWVVFGGLCMINNTVPIVFSPSCSENERQVRFAIPWERLRNWFGFKQERATVPMWTLRQSVWKQVIFEVRQRGIVSGSLRWLTWAIHSFLSSCQLARSLDFVELDSFECFISIFYFHSAHLIWNHSTEKPHKCSQCDSAFKTKPSLRNHVASIHSNERWVMRVD